MNKYGNMGNPDKLAAFMKIVNIAKRSPDATSIKILVVYDPANCDKFQIKKDDLKNLTYSDSDILMNGKIFCEWWDIEQVAIVFEL